MNEAAKQQNDSLRMRADLYDKLSFYGTMPNTKVALTNGTDTAFGSPPNLNVEGHPEKVLDFFDHG
jgi:hypothetical protein